MCSNDELQFSKCRMIQLYLIYHSVTSVYFVLFCMRSLTAGHCPRNWRIINWGYLCEKISIVMFQHKNVIPLSGMQQSANTNVINLKFTWKQSKLSKSILKHIIKKRNVSKNIYKKPNIILTHCEFCVYDFCYCGFDNNIF